MKIYREDSRICIEAQDFCISLPDTPINRKVLIVLLRWLRRSPKGGYLFTLKELAGIVESPNRQAASEHAEQFRACDEDFGAFIRRQRKVDEEVVDAVFAELMQDPLADIVVLCDRVGRRLDREDINESNIRAGLDKVDPIVKTNFGRI